MSRNPIRHGWLLVLGSLFYATFSFIVLFILSPDGWRALRAFAPGRTSIEHLGLVALAAGVCTVASAIWNVRETNSWLLALNGLACTALGIMVFLGASRRVTFTAVAFAIVVMAVSIGLYEFVTMKTLPKQTVNSWLLMAAGVVSVGFAVVFLAFALGWIRPGPSLSGQTFHWLGSYFAFSSICMLGLASRYFRPSPPIPIAAV